MGRKREKSHHDDSHEERENDPPRSKGRGTSTGFGRGDRVEIKSLSRGTRFYEGKVMKVNSDNTLDVEFDDGNVEHRVTEERVRFVEKASICDYARQAGSSDKLSKGDAVEARYHGKGLKFFKGQISRANPDGTYDIDYDDGDREVGLGGEHVRPLKYLSGNDTGSAQVEPDSGDGNSSLKKEDKVEVNYRGRGRYYKGRISHVNFDNTFDINFDDGEKERGVSKDRIRTLDRPASRSRDRKLRGSLQRGDKVEAQYRGRGVKFYKGKIARVNSDGTFDIDYDDGEQGIGLQEEHVRSLEHQFSTDIETAHERSASLREGDKIEANYRGRGRYYPGRISRINLDGTFNVDFDDGEKERGVNNDMIRPVDRTNANDKCDERERSLKVGDKVEARYRGQGSRFFKGKIVRANSDATFDIDYDDGDKDRGIAEKHVRLLESVKNDGRGGGRLEDNASELLEGDKVEADYRGRGRYLKGRIQKVHRDGTFDINYDDGKKERGVPKDMIRCLDKPGKRGRDRASGGSLQTGDKVEARYRGRGTKFYNGKIARVNSDGTFDIDYDDGEQEIGIREEHVRSLEQWSSSDDGRVHKCSASLREGDKIEADYRGRGRYYPGRVSRVNLDGTFNIDFDDGEKERGVTGDLVRPVDRVNACDKYDERERSLKVGDKVEARFRGQGSKFFKGNIVRVNSDATFDIDYDDGDKDRGIAEKHVRLLESVKNDGRGGGRLENNASKLLVGDKVEADYRGRGRCLKGRIQKIHRDGTFDINYDDGEKERGVPKDMIRCLDKPGGRGRGRASGSSLQTGDKVEARYRGRGTKFYKGKIARVNSDGTFDIDYDDGEQEIGIQEEHVRSLEQWSSSDNGSVHERSASLREGDKIEANYRGRGRYYPGRVSRVNLDGTFNIDFDDGEKERGVTNDLIRPVNRTNANAKFDKRKKIMKVGDKVEARYRGQGSKFFKGKIVRVNSDATFDIDYDDGDKDRGIAEKHVRSLENAENNGREGGRLEDNASELLEGNRVEANYRGRGRYLKGRIQRVHRDGTCDINYNDGEKERGVPKDMIRSLDKPGGRGRGRAHGGSLQRGDKVEAQYRGRGTKFYKGKIARVNSDSTFDIDYDDGEQEIGLQEEHVRSLEQWSSSDDSRVHKRSASLLEGDKIEANYRGRGRYYPGRISRVNLDGTFNIDFDDGEKERGVNNDMVRPVDRTNANGKCDERERSLKVGDKVEARYRGRGSRFFKGKIVRVNSDATFDIDYDDGDKDLGLTEKHVRALDGARNDGRGGGRLEDNAYQLLEGDKVEANYRGRGRYLKGRIQKVHRDGTVDISYDNGEKERDVPKDMIQTLDRPASRGHDRVSEGSLKRGDKVEARYRGRGTKFYKGKIARVNSDGTFDIDYDDGEQEIGIREEHVRSLEKGFSTDDDRAHGRFVSLREGDKIEANYRGRGRYYPGRVSRVNLDGTFNIDFDDGEKERGVNNDMIRPVDRANANDKCDERERRLKVGDKVEARYRGQGSRFFKGKIVRVNSDATFDIDYDDGDKDRGIAEKHVRSLEGAENDGRGGGRLEDNASELLEGDKVEADYRGRGRYLEGRIQRVHRDGTFDIDYDDGEKERGVPKDMIRSLDKPGGRGRGRAYGGSLQRGDKVEARYRGRGTKFCKGTIARVNSDSTFDIDYDDGEQEIGLQEEHVRSLEQWSSSDDGRVH